MQCLTNNQGRDPISNAMRVREPVQFIPYALGDLAKLGIAAHKSGSGAQDPV